MDNNKLPSLQKITWEKCRERVRVVNSELANIIDSLSPSTDMPLWIVKYPYGAVMDNGQFYYPTDDGKLVLLTDPCLSNILKEDFSYAGTDTPAGVVLNNSIEQFIETEDRIIPRTLFMPGDIFALWGRLDPQPIFHPSPLMCGTAGARSIFMIPNISDIAFHKKLRNDFNVRQPPPKRLIDQWSIFKTIVNQSLEGPNWQTEALLFTGRWLEKIKKDPSFQSLYVFFLEQAWRSSAYWRNKVLYDFVFCRVQEKRNLKPNPYLADTIKYLLAIAGGFLPAFGGAIDNKAAPINLIQKAYVECYGLKKYAPTIMHPMHFTSNQPVYYSLQFPTTLEFSPRSRKLSNTLHDLRELKHIFDVFLEEVVKDKLKVERGILGKIARNVNFDFFHSEVDRYNEISLTNEIIDEDVNLVRSLTSNAHKEFAGSGSFMRGCVRISRKVKKQT
jgi:hypothetical protein